MPDLTAPSTLFPKLHDGVTNLKHEGLKADSPVQGCTGLLVLWGLGDDLLSHGYTALSSAQRRFTVLFGMGRSGTNALWSPRILELPCWLGVRLTGHQQGGK